MDDVREVRRLAAMGGGDLPSKPISLYATVWPGASTWATSRGRYGVN